jgi:hypothetical protein
MAMGPEVMIGAGLAAINAVLLAILTVVWLRNYRTFQSNMVLGLAAFGAVLLLENLVAVYFFLSMHMLYANDPLVGQVVLAMRSLEFLAVVCLTSVTVQ